jgi:hypothetical protein
MKELLLWKGAATTSNATAYVDAHRRVLLLEPYGFGLFWQYKIRKTGEWSTAHTGAYSVHITRHWHLGPEHVYYDGPHCLFSLGFLHVQYAPRGGWCLKCMPEE